MDSSEVRLWEYPDLIEVLGEESTEQSERDFTHEESTTQETQIKEDVTSDKEVESLKQNIHELKAELEEKINVLNQLIQCFEAGLAGLPNELGDQIDFLIKSMVKKIIQKEVSDLPATIVKLINSYSGRIKSDETIISIEISPDLYKKMQSLDIENKKLFSPNVELEMGDLIIKTNHTIIRAIIDETIDKMLSGSDENAV